MVAVSLKKKKKEKEKRKRKKKKKKKKVEEQIRKHKGWTYGRVDEPRHASGRSERAKSPT